jgi:hypothetical protein
MALVFNQFSSYVPSTGGRGRNFVLLSKRSRHIFMTLSIRPALVGVSSEFYLHLISCHISAFDVSMFLRREKK